MIRRPPRSTQSRSSAASDVYKRQVVDHRDLDRDLVDRTGGQLLVGHLEAAVAVDRPDRPGGVADLRAHGGRHREAHRAQPTGVDPLAGTLVVDELGRPHLVLADAGDVDRLRTDDLTEPLDHVPVSYTH